MNEREDVDFIRKRITHSNRIIENACKDICRRISEYFFNKYYNLSVNYCFIESELYISIMLAFSIYYDGELLEEVLEECEKLGLEEIPELKVGERFMFKVPKEYEEI